MHRRRGQPPVRSTWTTTSGGGSDELELRARECLDPRTVLTVSAQDTLRLGKRRPEGAAASEEVLEWLRLAEPYCAPGLPTPKAEPDKERRNVLPGSVGAWPDSGGREGCPGEGRGAEIPEKHRGHWHAERAGAAQSQ